MSRVTLLNKSYAKEYANRLELAAIHIREAAREVRGAGKSALKARKIINGLVKDATQAKRALLTSPRDKEKHQGEFK